MMRSLYLVILCAMAAPSLVSAEFYSDVDSKDQDEAKALEIKAKDFWQGLMDGAQGLETTRNAELSARVEHALKRLPAKDEDIRELFLQAIGHLAKADSMLFEEAARSKMLALQRLEQGESRDALCDYVSENEDRLYAAYTRFVGHKTYEKKVARHVLARMKEAAPNLDRAAGMAPKMYEESEKASNSARSVLSSRDSDHKMGRLPVKLQRLALDIISATAKQRVRFQNYLYESLMATAEDLAGENEKATKTVMKARLRGVSSPHRQSTPPVEAEQKKPAYPLRPMDDEPPLIFADGVPVDAVPVLVF